MQMPTFFSKATKKWFQDTLGTPTRVQLEAWPEIKQGNNTLVSAPTGTGKTLTAFLVYIDELLQKSFQGTLEDELQVIYVSPLKALATDVRENLKRPLDGIYQEMQKEQIDVIKIANHIRIGIRTGDTTQTERRQMLKHPPHILITTPESLFLLLTSKYGVKMLSTAKCVILDELHAVLETKRGAHLMLSLARLDFLCKKPLQRVGLSATVKPLSIAANYLSPEKVSIIAPVMKKEAQIRVISPKPAAHIMEKDSVWRDIAAQIYDETLKVKSAIVFVDGRRFAEKLSGYMIQLGGEGFARVHHGSISKEQRHQAETELKSGNLRLLIATSSMELGIDVGEIERVYQVGNPFTIANTMQRLGRAGHRPNETSVMHIYPRTAEEALFCGMTAKAVRDGAIESMRPPKGCLDILAQHLVSMAATSSYEVQEVMPILKRAYSFDEVTIDEVRSVLKMLAGDYEHEENIPVRPRVIYDRINDVVIQDNYSRMLAVFSGGTIPDRGLYSVKNEAGIKLGEVEEEFVFEARVGDVFRLGSFAWRIQKITKDTVFVIPSESKTANLPFWKGDFAGRKFETGILFGKILRDLNEAYETDTLEKALFELGLDERCVNDVGEYIRRQIESTSLLPNDKTVIVEYFKDENGNHDMMIHSIFGKQINGPLALLLQNYFQETTKRTLNFVSNDEGIMVFPYDGKPVPKGMLREIRVDTAKDILEALLPNTPLFQIVFRYIAGRALMFGMNKMKRNPLWIQRVRGTQMLDSLIAYENHPLIVETKRECLEGFWDIEGTIQLLSEIQNGTIHLIEMYHDLPSPMSFLLRQKTVESLMYDYAPITEGIRKTTYERVKNVKDAIDPDKEQLEQIHKRAHLPENSNQLHSLFMMEGDLVAHELDLPFEWFETLLNENRIEYIEPGLWIACEQKEQYEKALFEDNVEAQKKLIVRLLRYRGGQSIQAIAQRYLFELEKTRELLEQLMKEEKIVFYEEMYYHKELFTRAQTKTILYRRDLVQTEDASHYAAFLCNQVKVMDTPIHQLEETVKSLCDQFYPVELWENVIFPLRVNGYREDLLDKLLAQGNYYYEMNAEKKVAFHSYDNIDWSDRPEMEVEQRSENEKKIIECLNQRGASFIHVLAKVVDEEFAVDELLHLMQDGIVSADSFIPVRYVMNESKIEKMALRQKISAKAKLLSAGRWDLVRTMKQTKIEDEIEKLFRCYGIVCKETNQTEYTFSELIEVLRVWEYVGKVRRGYFVRGLSGIQFILEEEYQKMVHVLKYPSSEILWISAIDPMQPWGKRLPHETGKEFICVLGTYVAMKAGNVAAVMEKKGKVLRVFDFSQIEEVMKAFVVAFSRKQIYTTLKRITIKEYPAEASECLHKAGFKKEITDYVLYL